MVSRHRVEIEKRKINNAGHGYCWNVGIEYFHIKRNMQIGARLSVPSCEITGWGFPNGNTENFDLLFKPRRWTDSGCICIKTYLTLSRWFDTLFLPTSLETACFVPNSAVMSAYGLDGWGSNSSPHEQIGFRFDLASEQMRARHSFLADKAAAVWT
jgi:hypothetical protein